MRRITDEELVVLDMLVTETQDAMQDVAVVLGEDAPAVASLRQAYDFVRGFRDAGFWCAEANQ